MHNLYPLRRLTNCWWKLAFLPLVLVSPGSLMRAAAQTSPAPADGLATNDFTGAIQAGVQTLSIELGTMSGLKIFGGSQYHDLALASISYGQVLGPVLGADHWYGGNYELRLEAFGGSQYSPTTDFVFGVTPHLRYDFATGTRWVPFVDAGAGLTATDISRPDLSNTFEFNLQVGAGLHCRLSPHWALTVEERYFHISDAGLTHPNHGLNGAMGMIGLTRFF
jgi:opacity protein-like surface antigen